MPIVVPEVAAINLGFWLFNDGAGFPAAELKLFVNDLTPEWDTVLADFLEASFSGYSPAAVPVDTWTVAPGEGDMVTATYPTEFTFTSGSAGGTCFGYYLIEPLFSNLIWCQRFDTPAPIVVGTVVEIRPKLGLWSRYLPPPP